jgi:hypothetical protein
VHAVQAEAVAGSRLSIDRRLCASSRGCTTARRQGAADRGAVWGGKERYPLRHWSRSPAADSGGVVSRAWAERVRDHCAVGGVRRRLTGADGPTGCSPSATDSLPATSSRSTVSCADSRWRRSSSPNRPPAPLPAPSRPRLLEGEAVWRARCSRWRGCHRRRPIRLTRRSGDHGPES